MKRIMVLNISIEHDNALMEGSDTCDEYRLAIFLSTQRLTASAHARSARKGPCERLHGTHFARSMVARLSQVLEKAEHQKSEFEVGLSGSITRAFFAMPFWERRREVAYLFVCFGTDIRLRSIQYSSLARPTTCMAPAKPAK